MVTLIQDDNRKQAIQKALEPWCKRFKVQLQEAKLVLIKPNLVHHQNQLASTHLDVVRAVIEWVRAVSAAEIVVGDCSYHGTKAAFKNFGYENLVREFENVRLIDLNDDDVIEEYYRIDQNGQRVPIKRGLSRLAVEADFKISLANLKTHRNVGVTLGIKNWAIGTWVVKPALDFRGRTWSHFRQLHGHGQVAHHRTIAALYSQNRPDLHVIDAHYGMEGDGPTSKEAVAMKLALASDDGVAIDSLACRLMGINPQTIPYLQQAAELGCGIIEASQIEIQGNVDWRAVGKQFAKPPRWSKIIG